MTKINLDANRTFLAIMSNVGCKCCTIYFANAEEQIRLCATSNLLCLISSREMSFLNHDIPMGAQLMRRERHTNIDSLEKNSTFFLNTVYSSSLKKKFLSFVLEYAFSKYERHLNAKRVLVHPQANFCASELITSKAWLSFCLVRVNQLRFFKRYSM